MKLIMLRITTYLSRKYNAYTNEIIKELLMKSVKFSLTMIVKDEELVLERCINSIRDLVDEYCILDTGSTDKTPEIISKYGTLYSAPFKNFVDSRNDALSYCTEDWVITMDADEWLEGDFNKIYEYINNGAEVIWCPIYLFENENQTQGEKFYRPRMWKRHANIKWGGPGIHEFLIIDGFNNVYTDDIICKHISKPNKDWGARQNQYLTLLQDALDKNPNDARAQFYMARTLKENNNAIEAIKYYNQYLSRTDLYYKDEIWQAYFDLAYCYMAVGDTEGSWKATQGAITTNDKRSDSWVCQGAHYESIKDYDGAIKSYIKACECVPQTGITLFYNDFYYNEIPKDNLGRVYCITEQYNKAEEILYDLLTHGRPDYINANGHIRNNYMLSRQMNNLYAEYFKSISYVPTKNKTLILQVPIGWDGLGDNMIFSHIPRIAKESGKYNKVLVSTITSYKGQDYRRICWDYNPYVDGFVNDSGTFTSTVDFRRILTTWKGVSSSMNIMDSMMLLHGLDDGKRFHNPEIYYKPKDLPFLNGKLVIDMNAKTSINLEEVTPESIMKIAQEYYNEPINYQIEIGGSNSSAIHIDGVQVLTTSSIEEYFDIVCAASGFICLNSGSIFARAAYNKKATVIINGNSVPLWMSPQQHNYIRI